ncbi:heterokaryon incompatibility protein-domain-containing protein [Paraphoma chrysanthemicola]|uniref:Heterokaryon incompatibility protein-domain-containing protein n=1 Tax=Paraphoma chrysanthemicola TaxID=798071 RepID=A0A8K0W406_9PLEO|nr:heterokaryon incompatibility protein-domain-containing protein [Paraphoma chrysanthemicola]
MRHKEDYQPWQVGLMRRYRFEEWLYTRWWRLRRSRKSYLCNFCRGICVYDAVIRINKRFLYEGDGCAFCAILGTVILPYILTMQDHFTVRNSMWGLEVCVEEVKGRRHVIEVSAPAGSPWEMIGPRIPHAREDPELAVAFIKACLENCDSDHPQCQRSRPSRLPSRVLELRGPKDVRLHVGEFTEADRLRYACLSHCWGGTVPLRTTKDTVQSFLADGIPWDSLPLTFQHAANLTHRLGLRYLWIDSLCIIQDDEEDWRHHGSSMCNIYSGSYVTLAATGAPNSAHGMFTSFPRENDCFKYFNIADPRDERQEYEIVAYDKSKSTRYEDLPLSGRAWFFQERLLSPRIVHFTDDMIFWECLGRSMDERGNEITQFSLPKAGDFEPKVNQPGRLWTGGAKLEIGDFGDISESVRVWHRIVSAYTRLDLTYDKDLLVALQGVAKSRYGEAQSAYHAGLWEKTLLSDLLWNRKEAVKIESGAPSWSWASARGPAAWPVIDETYRDLATVVSVHTDLAGNDSMGEITGGKLVLAARCFSGIVRRRPLPSDNMPNNNPWIMPRIFPDFRGSSLEEKQPWLDTWWWFWSPDRWEGPEDQRVFCALIAEDRNRFYYLMLTPVEGEQTLRRIGLGEASAGRTPGWFREFGETRTVTIV